MFQTFVYLDTYIFPPGRKSMWNTEREKVDTYTITDHSNPNDK